MMARPDGSDWSVQQIGSLEQKISPVKTNTIVTAGSTLNLNNGGIPWTTDKKQVGIGCAVTASTKWKVQIFQMCPDDSAQPFFASNAIDQSAAASYNNGGKVDLFVNSYYIKFTNSDAVDITIRYISRAEMN